ncbi:MAG: hypothetical protein M3O78_02880 [Chloroflexota bacterium]|nr:hypothetical protein [Chloroflexota bacterium]
MRAPEPINAVRVVAHAATLNGLSWPDGAAVLRLAVDDLLVIGAASAELADEAAIIEDERGFVGWWLTPGEVREKVLPHIEWPLPSARPALAQGLIAGVPARLWLGEDRALLLCAAAYAHELEERLP